MVRIGERVDFIDKTGKYVINPQFDSADDFCEGLAVVSSDGKSGYINKNGKYVIHPQFQGMPEFKNGVAIVYTEGKDKDGNDRFIRNCN